MEDSSTSKKLYDKLKSDTGVDFLALRQKYDRGTGTTEGVKQVDVDIAAEVRRANERLDKYTICKACNGQGFVKIMYNHQSKQTNCPECEGEQVIFSEKALDAATRSIAER